MISYAATVRIRNLTHELLVALGENPTREGLRGTPDRVARFWSEFIDFDAGNVDVSFESASVDQMIIVKNIHTYSLCEHHLLPIILMVHIGYIADKDIVGLSKLARVAHLCAHRLQVQERLTCNIANEVESIAHTRDVAVLVEGVHLCMLMRGIRTEGTMVTSDMRGKFRNSSAARAEFLQLIGGNR